MPRKPLLLASGSPRRAELLTAAGLAFTVMPIGVDETWNEGEAPVQYAKRVAMLKAQAAAARRPGVVVLGADTVVWRSPRERPLAKPRDREQAREHLLALSRDPTEPHFVTTGWAVLDGTRADATIRTYQETTRVWLRALDPDELEQYLETGDWKDKAGGYGIQGRAGSFVTRIEGSYTNVVGLPVAQVLEALHKIEREAS